MLESQYKMNLIKVGLKIAYYRKLQGMTQEELAEACGLSAGYISQLEGPNSYFCPSLKTLFIIAEVLNTTAAKLIDIDD
ncbi:MAG: helix-turn-helix transcriptional regulator [Clostridia bacterium]|nr:helix-turn-helix transcriptional regulator [Clostridia bacterium]